MPDDLRDRLAVALTAARRARDAAGASALRSVICALDNAGAVPAPDAPAPVGDGPIAGAVTGLGATEAPRRELSPDAVAALVEAEIADLLTGADEAERLGRPERADELRHGADVVRRALVDGP